MSSTTRVGSSGTGKLRGLVEAAKAHGPSLAVLTALTVVMCRNLIFSNEFPGGWDVASITYPLGYFSRTGSYFSLWEDSVTGYVTPLSLFHLLAFVAAVLGDAALISRAVLVFSVLSSALLMYVYTFAATGRVLASLASGVIFATSPWLAANTADGHGFLIIAYALAPLLFLLLDRGLERVTWPRILGLGLVLGILPSLRFDPLAYLLPFVGLFALWHVAAAGRQWRGALARAVRLLLPAGTLGLLLSAYAWLPLLSVSTAHATIRYTLAQIANDTLSFWPSLLGQGLIYSYIFWRGGTSHYTHQFLPPLLFEAVLFLTPALAFAQVRWRDNRRVSFFVLAALLSVFLAKGPWPPLGQVYDWLWRYVPLVDQLHVPNRGLMVAWVAYAFLAGLTIDRLYRWARQRLGVGRRGWLTQAGSAAMVVLPLIGCGVGISYVFTDGYQTWQMPEGEVAPHRWLAENRSAGRFLDVPTEGSRGFLPGGWIQHDLGFLGGVFSGRPSFDELPFEGYESDFFVYLQGLIQQRAAGLAKILGAYDVRYVVVQGYSSNTLPGHPVLYDREWPARVVLEYWEHQYFDKLKGLKLVYEGSDPRYDMLVGLKYERELTYKKKGPRLWPLPTLRRPLIYENEYWLPRAFVPKSRMLVVGGVETLGTMAGWEGFDFQDWDICFASRTLDELGREGLIEALRETDLLVFNNSELLDLTMMINDSARADFSALAEEPDSPWSAGGHPSYFKEDRIVLRTTENGAQARVPIQIQSAGSGAEYELWTRVFYGPGSSLIRFEVDGRQVGVVLPSALEEVGFVWQKVGLAKLEPGPHEVSVTALSTTGAVDARIDEIALVRSGAMDEATDLLATIVEQSRLPVVSLQEEGRLWRPYTMPTELSRSSQLDIRLDQPREEGVRRALYGGQPEVPQFQAGGRFTVRRASPEGGYTPLLQLEFEEPQDWREATYLRLAFKGVGAGDKVRLRVAFSGEGTAFYSFEDLSSEWERITIPLFDPERTEGTLRWDQVSMLIVDTSGLDLGNGTGLGTIRVLQDTSSLEHLDEAMGTETIVLGADGRAPASAARFFSPTREQPAEIVNWIEASPWQYQLRISAAEPYNLVVSNTYDPLWRVILDGQELAPQPAYYFVSSYEIDRIGEYDLTLEFVGQRYQWLGFAVSGLAYGATIAAGLFWLARAWRTSRQGDGREDARGAWGPSGYGC